MTEHTPSEPLHNPERLISQNNSALQMRLFMGGEAVIYPPKEIKSVTSESISQEHEKNKIGTFKKLGITATTEGHTVWSQGEKSRLNHDQKVQTWATEVDTLFKSEGTKLHQKALQSLSIGGINLGSINQETAIRLYERYFRKTEAAEAVTFGERTTYIPANIKRFVDDVIAAHAQGGKTDFQALEQKLDPLTFLAGMFGTNTSALLKDYLTAYIKYNKNQESQTAFINEVNTDGRIDLLTDEEKKRLKWFYETSTQIKVVKIEQKQQASAHPAKPESTASVDQGLAQQPEPIVIEPKKDFVIEEKPKVFVIEPPEIPDYSKLSKDERLNNLPGDTLRSAQFFCENLRKRIQKDGTAQPTKGPNNEDLLIITDPVTNRINVTVGKREYVDHAWFPYGGFIQWATENGMPLIFIHEHDNHAQILLKLEKKGEQMGYKFYDPMSSGGEQWSPFAKQLTYDEYIQQEVNEGRLIKKVAPINGHQVTSYFWPGSSEGSIQFDEKSANEGELYGHWLEKVMPWQVFVNVHAGNLLAEDQFDLTLENDRELPEHIKNGKIQHVQLTGDGFNCIPLAFFINTIHYLAQPGMVQEKKALSKTFQEHFGVRILTREEILG